MAAGTIAPTTTVRALTVRQPFAAAIAHSSKRCENRSKAIPQKHLGITLLIHAGKEPHDSGVTAAEFPGGEAWPDTRSAIVAVARLARCHYARTHCCPTWGFTDQWHWILEDVTTLKTPVPATGALGLWTPPPAVLDAVRAQHNLREV